MKTKIFTTISILFLTSCASEIFTTECKVLSKSFTPQSTSSSIHSNYNAGTNTFGMPTSSFRVQEAQRRVFLNCGSYGELTFNNGRVWRYTEAGKSYMFDIKLSYWGDKIKLTKEDKDN